VAIMESKENLYLNDSELNLYNSIQMDILKTKNPDTIESLKQNAFNLLNGAIYRSFSKPKSIH
jgi:hypothetical protein